MFLKTQQIPKATIVKNKKKKKECVNRQIQHHEHKCVYQERMIYGTEKKKSLLESIYAANKTLNGE